mmetsp:Transcript_20110/g.57711  ORF Transcript_20110/g.57711 Transcript_20110/m.57711 type:complete len:225 (-) Transcript_20110:23-697(-)
MLVVPVSPPNISFTCCVDLAVLALAASCSFFDFASKILDSSICIPSYSLSMASAWESICTVVASLASACCCRRDRASRASSSLPALRASWALLYQSSARASDCSFCFRRRRWVAVTSAYDWRILTKSFCMSSTACDMIFSGSSRVLRTLLRLDLATREKRSNRFIERAVVDAAGAAPAPAGRATATWRPTNTDDGAKPSTWQAMRAVAAAADRILMATIVAAEE